MRAVCGILIVIICGCRADRTSSPPVATQPPFTGLTTPQYVASLRATVAPPAGWTLGTREDSTAEGHQVWVSPTGKTAYGVINFSLPLPVGHDLVLWVFLNEMKRNEGEAKLLEKQWDPNQRLLRFVAKGGKYTVRTTLTVRGFRGWAVYAGTLTSDPVVPHELALAELAREHTLVAEGRAR